MSLPLWEECAWAKPIELDFLDPVEEVEAIFPVDHEINKKIYLHQGVGYKIPCDVCITGQNEHLNDHTEDLDAIFALAGPQLEGELEQLAPIQTGEAVMTTGGSLPCEWLIHAVGPRYDERYLTASDHALFSAVKTSLFLAVEKCKVNAIPMTTHSTNPLAPPHPSLPSNPLSVSAHPLPPVPASASGSGSGSSPELIPVDIVLTCVYTRRKKYPRYDAAHVLLRTVRKFLSHPVGGGVRKIMFAVPTLEDYDIFNTLLIAYFPRTPQEAAAQVNLLPADLGDEWGALVQNDRVLKVSAGPQKLTEKDLEEYRASAQVDEPAVGPRKTGTRSLLTVGATPTSMTDMGRDKDSERAAQIAREFALMNKVDRMRLKFASLVEDLADCEEQLAPLAELDFIKIAGSDRLGRTVVLISVDNLQLALQSSPRPAEDDMVMFCMQVMEPLRCRPFVLVYAYANTYGGGGGGEEGEDALTSLTSTIFSLITARYLDNLMALYLLHPSLLQRTFGWLVSSSPLEGVRAQQMANLQQLDKFMEVGALDIPEVVRAYDKTLY